MGIFNSKCTSSARLDGKVVVVTGANTGIGKECSKEFYLRGAKVIMACRSAERAQKAIEHITDESKDRDQLGSLRAVQLDLSSLQSVRDCAREICSQENRIDILLNNAGIMACPESRTVEGFEMQFGTNHLGHFLFTLLLMPKLRASNSEPVRIVNVSSLLHTSGRMCFEDLNWNERPYSAIAAYKQSKLANILFAKELSRRLQNLGLANIHTYSLNPGIINTELGRHLSDTFIPGATFLFNAFGIFWKSPEQGAQTSIYCCVSEEAANETGLYYNECKVAPCSERANDMEDAKTLWECSIKMVELTNFDPFQ